jgi:autotransporter-associated beta strand protein
MNKKAILELNSTTSVRPAAWLALAILAVGAFGNSVQAQTVWLNENFSGYSTDGGSLNTTTSPNLISAGTSWTVSVAGSVKKLRTYKPAGAGPTFGSSVGSTPAKLAYKLSTDANNATDRPVGYISYKITPGADMANTFNANAADGSYMEVGLGPTGLDVPGSAGNLLLWGRFYFNNSSTTPRYKVRFYELDATFTTKSLGSGPVTLNSGENTIKIWYNKSASGVSYTPPSGGSSVTLAANSWVAYVNDTIATGFNATGAAFVNTASYTTGTTQSTAVGKFGAFGGASGHTYDFSLSDIYVADSAPAVSAPFAISSATTATVQAGSSFSYQITTSGGTATSYNATGLPSLPSSYLSINTATGVISGTVPASTTPATIPIVLSATTGATTVTANLSLTVTAAPSDYVWANTGTDWSSAASWTNNAVPSSTSTAGFGSTGSSVTSVNVGTGQSIAAIVFYPGAFAYTWTGTDITVGNVGGITNNSTAIQTFGNKVINTGAVGDTTWSTVSGGSLVFSGGIDLTTTGSSSSRTLTFAGAGNVTVNSVIADGGNATAGAIVSANTGTTTLSGANTYRGTTKVAGGTLVLSNTNTSSGYILAGTSANVVLKVNAINALNSSATLLGSSSSGTTGTLEFATAGNYTLNQYTGQNMYFNNSSGSATTLTFTNATNVLGTTTTGKTFANKSASLTITFNGEVDISGSTAATNTITTAGPVVISNRVYNTNSAGTRSLYKDDTNTLTMYGVNSYNGTTTVKQGTLVIPTGGSLANCGTTVVAGSGTSAANSASLNLGGAAGVVQVGTNGFVRGYTSGSTTTLGTITSLQVQDTGTVEVPVVTTWTTGGTISFTGASTKISVTGTPVAGNTYTLITAAADITGTPTLVSSANTVGWGLRVTGSSIYLEEVGVVNVASGQTTIYSALNYLTGAIPLTKRGEGKLVLSNSNDYTSATSLEAGTLEIQNSNALGSGTGALVYLKGGILKSTVDLDLAKSSFTTTTVGTGNTDFQTAYGAISNYVKYSGNNTTISGPVTLDVGTNTTMTMVTLVGNSDANSLVTKIGAGTVKLLGGSTKVSGTALAANGNASTVLGGWRIQEGMVWFSPSSNNGGGNGPITLAGGSAKFTKLQNSNGTYTGFEVPSDLMVENDGLIQYDPDASTLLGQNTLGFNNLSIGSKILEVATATSSTVVGQSLPRVNFKSGTLTGSATFNNPVGLDLALQAVSGTGGFTKTGLGTLYLSEQPNQAAAFATLTTSTMTVESINVEYAGSGYTAIPAVTLVGGGATTQATAQATINNGRVTSIAVLTPGVGYTSLPRVVIAAPPTVATASSYTGATTVQEGKLNLSGRYASSVTVKSGAALQLDWLAAAEARCSIDQVSSKTTDYNANAANAVVKDLYLTKSVSGYTPGDTLTLTIEAPRKTDGTTLFPGGVAATATATVDSQGVISALNIVTGGSGYVISPRVTIPAPTVPTAVATTTGSITFESGATLALNIASPTSASYTLVTADGGINGTPVLQTSIPGYALTKSSDGKSLILDQVDTTKPVIALIGDSSVNVVYGSSYSDLGARVTDNKDAERAINGTGSVDTSVSGTYIITFNATDAAGNVADTVTRTVVVGAAPDTTKPVIALIGNSSVNVAYGSSYSDLGARVTDNKDAERAINGTGSVDTSVSGTYIITFNATDAAGNVADTVTRTVVVGAAPVTDGFALYLSSNGLVGTAFNAKVNGVTAGLVYSFGSANGMPQNNGVTAVPVMSGNQLTYTFDVKDDSALTVTYQTSSDLVTWTAAQPVSVGAGTPPAGFVKKQVQATGSGKLFVKINVTHP